MYEVPPRNLCDRARLDDLALRLGLIRVVETPGHLRNHGENWLIACGVGGQSDDGQLATELGRFDPGGMAWFKLRPDLGEAVEEYERLVEWQKRQTDLNFHASADEVEGWWDEGGRLRTFRPLEAEDFGVEELDAVYVEVRYAIRHHNLVVEVYVDGRLPSGYLDEGYRFLDDLAVAMMEAAKPHLTVTAGG